ncbi:MAG: hypothetical protein CL557_12305 [Alphaproteobacteria bacterium]|nr:hypothetical protein [Alphaproteobacteria bacterium]
MKYKIMKTHKERMCSNMTYRVGEIETTYGKLLHSFGKPYPCDGYKVDAEWTLQFDDGQVATIYNWKDGHNYLGEDGTSVEDITDWHIGGRKEIVVRRVKEILAREEVTA